MVDGNGGGGAIGMVEEELEIEFWLMEGEGESARFSDGRLSSG